jgi:coenzyme F420 hydrogenase subunit beta
MKQQLSNLLNQKSSERELPYFDIYRSHYGKLPDNWLTGISYGVYTGFASDENIRRAGASGGVMTAVLLHLLKTGKIDAAIVVRQGVPIPEKASAVVAKTPAEILAAAQSVYVPVSVLECLREVEPGKRYAMTCLPEEAAALRQLQQAKYPPAEQIAYLLGPYTGTALKPEAIRCLLRSNGVKNDDPIISLKWRAGEWPGYLEVIMGSGKIVRSKKVYYNFLIPFFITGDSLLSMDFANEFCDLSVGDAWSPAFESLGGGHSVVVTRSREMEGIIQEMIAANGLTLKSEDPLKASEMHGHMIDFKKRGGYIRIRLRRMFGLAVPKYGIRPSPLPVSRWVVEFFISGLFLLCGNPIARKLLEYIPESIIGPVFNWLRLIWKALSRPTKRKGLSNLKMFSEK